MLALCWICLWHAHAIVMAQPGQAAAQQHSHVQRQPVSSTTVPEPMVCKNVVLISVIPARSRVPWMTHLNCQPFKLKRLRHHVLFDTEYYSSCCLNVLQAFQGSIMLISRRKRSYSWPDLCARLLALVNDHTFSPCGCYIAYESPTRHLNDSSCFCCSFKPCQC